MQNDLLPFPTDMLPTTAESCLSLSECSAIMTLLTTISLLLGKSPSPCRL